MNVFEIYKEKSGSKWGLVWSKTLERYENDTVGACSAGEWLEITYRSICKETQHWEP